MRHRFLFALFLLPSISALAACDHAEGQTRRSVVNTRPQSSESGRAPSGINADDLCQHWVHSYEEKQPGDKDQIFRPAAFKQFPPSRFRMQYKFARNGDCEWFYLAPDDAHYFKHGKWMLDPNDKTILRITKGVTTESFRITKLTKDLLRMVPIEPKRNK